MNKHLIFLHTIIPLTFLGNTVNTSFHKTINHENTILINETAENNASFNNQFNYLSTSDWITNQSTVDYKFYSYDTSALKNYSFANARNVFLVDNTGILVYNSAVTIPNKDKVNIENTKQEMIRNKKVNTINDDYNPYSKSEYSNKYFNGDNNNWQYLQQGGVESHIDISQQVGGNKVEYSNNLNQTLGLYYITKAVQQNKISQTIANNLAIYFINQSSLKGQISDKLTTIIVNLINNNQKIYNFLYNSPMQLTMKNYSLNWIFDKNNNLIEIYYNKWSNINNAPNDKINYSFSDWYAGISQLPLIILMLITSLNEVIMQEIEIHLLICIQLLPLAIPTLKHQHQQELKVVQHYQVILQKLNSIKSWQCQCSFFAYINTKDGGSWGTEIALNLNLWHDNNNIYFQWYCFLNSSFGRNTYVNIKLNSINFYNIMNN